MTAQEFKKIVVGFDGSTAAHDALDVACRIAGDDAEVHVVTAYDEPSLREVTKLYASVPAELTANIDVLAGPRNHLKEAESHLERCGIKHRGHFIDDDPAGAILDVADHVAADLIVVGCRGMGQGTRFVRGSVSTRVANHAQTSLLIVQV